MLDNVYDLRDKNQQVPVVLNHPGEKLYIIVIYM